MKNLPVFPLFRPVSIDDRTFFEETFRLIQPEVSELNFTNLFMFQCVHAYRVAELNGNVIILATSYSGEPYFFPPVGDNEVPATLRAMTEYMAGLGIGSSINIAPKGFIDRYIAPDPSYAFEPDPDSSDYLYDAEELRGLTGRKFHDKKNLLNRFIKSHDHEYRTLTPELVPEAMDLVERWCKEKCSDDVPSTYRETDATMLCLANLGRLSVKGGVVLIEGRVQALSLGEELNRETVVVHVEKANHEFPGLYQFMSNSFLVREFPSYRFVNREQDLGEPNLRKSKLSYNPIRMIEKYRVWLKV